MEINPYNSLGQILASGGEIATAIGFAHGRSRSDQLIFVRNRFAPLTPDEEDYLLDFSLKLSGMDAVLREFDPNSIIPITAFPRNPLLFGDDWGGKRVIVGMDVETPESGRSTQVRVTFPDSPTFADLFREAAEELERRVRASPGEFDEMSDEELAEIIIHILFAERRY